MDVLYPRCAGLDVHKDTVVACARMADGARAKHEVQTFGTTTPGLLALADWLRERGCTHVAMEATGIYWKPVWHVLEAASLELVLANAAHIRNVPGRKTDVNDATWIADLLAHGLIRGSFVPPAPIQALRALTRTRKQIVREKKQHVQRIQKVLEDSNIKLDSIVSDIMGKSARAVLQALAAGESDPQKLVALTSGRLKATREQLLDALRGTLGQHHRFLLKLHLEQVDALDRAIEALEREAGDCLEPFRANVELLTGIPGVSNVVAQVIVAEIGCDMSRFPTSGDLISWAGLCPKSDETAGKRRSTRLRHGAPWLKTVLVQAAWCAHRAKGTYLRAQYFRLRARAGPKKAVVGVAASILTAAYFMLRDGVPYRDLGPDYFNTIDKDARAQRHIKSLESLGYKVKLEQAA
jgi:transposase